MPISLRHPRPASPHTAAALQAAEDLLFRVVAGEDGGGRRERGKGRPDARHRRVVAGRTALQGTDARGTMRALHCLGAVLLEAGRPKEAETLLR